MAYGLLSTGFSLKPLDVILDDLRTLWRSKFGASIDVSFNSIDGQLLGIIAERVYEVWLLAQECATSQDVDAVTGAAQDQLYALTGCVRRPASRSTVVLTLTGTNATLVAAGSRASVTDAGDQFETIADATIATLDAWAQNTAYNVGDRVTNDGDGTDRVYVCITTGTSANGTGPDAEDADVLDGSVHWRFVGFGDAAADADSQAVETGPIVATSGAIVTITTPVGGWSSVMNLLDADLGADREGDGEYRLRRELELAASGETTPDAIRATILEIDGVTSCTVFYNNTDVTDGDGLPPHSVEVLVRGGVDQDIVDTLFQSCIAAGIATYGNTSGTATDSEGTDHTINFSRPDEITIYVDVTYTYDAATFPADGEDQIKAAIVAFGDAFSTGRDAVAVALGSQAFKVAGVLDVPRSGSLGGTLIKTSATPTSDATIAIARRELATFDTSRVTLHGTPGTP